MKINVVTCGCCSNGCCCHNHMDIPRGRLPGKCDVHRKRQFVVLRGVTTENRGCVFCSMFTEGDDPTKSSEGETWYEVLGYTETLPEAQRMVMMGWNGLL